MISLQNIREELTHFLRNQDVLSTTVRGVTTVSESFTSLAGQTTYTPNHTNIKNIRSLTIDSADKYFLRDYTINWSTGVITFNSSLSVGQSIVISYDYGTDKIWPDYPREDLTLNSFPRIAIEIINGNSEPFGLGGINQISDIMISILLWIPVNKDSSLSGIGGNKDLNDIISNIRDKLRLNSKTFTSFKYIKPVSMGPLAKGFNDKIIQTNIDLEIKFITE